MSNELFVEATRNKYRFQSDKGLLSVEDLWSLKPEFLNTLYIGLQKQIVGEQGLLTIPSTSDTELRNKMNIVKFIFDDKKDAADRAMIARAERERKEKIADIISKKKNEALESMSVEELEALLK